LPVYSYSHLADPEDLINEIAEKERVCSEIIEMASKPLIDYRILI
jgi:hypothetical protein